MGETNNNLDQVDLLNDFTDKDLENAKGTDEMQEAGEKLEKEKPLTEEQKKKCRDIYNELTGNIYNKQRDKDGYIFSETITERMKTVRNSIGYLKVEGDEIQFVSLENYLREEETLKEDNIINIPDIKDEMLGNISKQKFVEYVNTNIRFMPTEYINDKDFWILRNTDFNTYSLRYNRHGKKYVDRNKIRIIEEDYEKYKNYPIIVMTLAEQYAEEYPIDFLYRSGRLILDQLDEPKYIEEYENLKSSVIKKLSNDVEKISCSNFFGLSDFLSEELSPEDMKKLALQKIKEEMEEDEGYFVILIQYTDRILKLLTPEDIEDYYRNGFIYFAEDPTFAFFYQIKDASKVLPPNDIKEGVTLAVKKVLDDENMDLFRDAFGDIEKILSDEDLLTLGIEPEELNKIREEKSRGK